MKPEDIVRQLNETRSRDSRADDELGAIANNLETAFRDLQWSATIAREKVSSQQVEGRRSLFVKGAIHAPSHAELQQHVEFRIQLILEHDPRRLSATVGNWNKRSVNWQYPPTPIGADVDDLMAAAEALAAWMLEQWADLIQRYATL